MSTGDGGAAFPVSTIDGYAQIGMTLRDYFAAKAMATMLMLQPKTAALLCIEAEPDDCNPRLSVGCLAEGAYEMADAMLAARMT